MDITYHYITHAFLLLRLQQNLVLFLAGHVRQHHLAAVQRHGQIDPGVGGPPGGGAAGFAAVLVPPYQTVFGFTAAVSDCYYCADGGSRPSA